MTKALDVSSVEQITLGKADELDDIVLPDDASSNQTFTDGGVGPLNGQPADQLGFFRCKTLDLAKLVTSKQHLSSFRRYVYFKYVFLVGGTQAIFDSQVMNRFL